MSAHETLDEIIAQHNESGFHLIDEGPRTPGLRVGARVHNRGEQFRRAAVEGTATVVAVLRRGTDENPDSWERRYGRPNVEVVVQSDRDETGDYRCWADYGTYLAEQQPQPTNHTDGSQA